MGNRLDLIESLQVYKLKDSTFKYSILSSVDDMISLIVMYENL